MESRQAVIDVPQPDEDGIAFAGLGLDARVLEAVEAAGYATPTPVQAALIPLMLERRDVIGQAQTGTGKTAAFALPLLSMLTLSRKTPTVLVLTPTRELALQVADSFRRYGARLPGLRVAAIYGGQSYTPQLRALASGAQVVVGTPGRVMDHLRRGSLDIGAIDALVLDEADEMLNMGFAEDVEFILSHTPEHRQTALFSATMPAEIRRLAQRYLRNPAEIRIESATSSAATIRQRYWIVRGLEKDEALSRLLEVEPVDGVLVFVRTKEATGELAAYLESQGHAADALNGDMPQAQREQTVERFKRGRLHVLVATDVAARGLDVDRISHVINFDVPYDPESYIHRIGRTGRAGRTGEAILFLLRREQRHLSIIERATRQPMTRMYIPDAAALNAKRQARLHDRIAGICDREHLDPLRALVVDYVAQSGRALEDVAAALAHLATGGRLLLPPDPPGFQEDLKRESRRLPPDRPGMHRGMPPGAPRISPARNHPPLSVRDEGELAADAPGETPMAPPDSPLVPYRIEVGASHGAHTGMLVAAITREAGIDGRSVGRISIRAEHSIVELPQALEEHLHQALGRYWVCGRMMRISRVETDSRSPSSGGQMPFRPRGPVGPGSSGAAFERTGQLRSLPRRGLRKK